MKKKRKSILLLATMGVFLISGCGAKDEVPTPSELFVNDEVFSSVAEETTAVNETQSITPDEIQPETPVQNEEAANTESASEPEPSSEQKTKTTQTASDKESDSKQETKTTQTASDKEPNSKQETKTTQTASDKEVKYTDISHIFKPYEQVVEISFQMPENWNYRMWDVMEESPDWGYSIEVCGRDDASIDIRGQYGTMTGLESNGPKSFQTSQGLTGQYYWDEHTSDNGNLMIQGSVLFDTDLLDFYGAGFYMPKSVYNENKDIIDKVFQSIVIKEVQ